MGACLVRQRECFESIARHWDGELVITSLGSAAHEWHRVTSSDEAFYLVDGMGFASSLALGLAVGLPEARVWVLDTDGAFIFNLGGVLTEADAQPANLVHFLVSNREYRVIGGNRLVNAHQTDYVGLAHSVGIKNVHQASTLAEVSAALTEVSQTKEYALVILELEREPGWGRSAPRGYEGPEMKYRFGRHIERRYGVTVFGPQGV
jgi:thiamine pyrophosphate-dependent acetolactate synthase large subunit-like protein